MAKAAGTMPGLDSSDGGSISPLSAGPRFNLEGPALALKRSAQSEDPATFPDVLRRELDAVEQRRSDVLQVTAPLRALAAGQAVVAAWTGRSPELVAETRKIEERALNLRLFGVALSGGGIRSATFCLGVLQSLASHGLLPHIDFLSTVSGGGYIGGWFTTWLRREGESQETPPHEVVANVQLQLSPSRAQETKGRLRFRSVVFDDDPEPIHHLRAFSNYLAPRVGLFSADSWVLGAIYCRNLLLNQLALIPFILAILLGVRILVMFYQWEPDHRWELALTVLWLLSFFVAAAGIGASMWRSSAVRAGTAKDTNLSLQRSLLQWTLLVPLLVFAILLCWLAASVDRDPLDWQLVVALDRYVSLRAFLTRLKGTGAYDEWFNAALVGLPLGIMNALKYVWIWVAASVSKDRSVATGDRVWSLICGFLVGSLYGALAYFIFVRGFYELYFTAHNEQLVAVVGPPIALLLFVLASFIEVGLQRESIKEDDREWWSSLAGWIAIYAAIWLAVFGLALGGPPAVDWLGRWSRSAQGIAVGGWALSTLAGVLTGKSPATSGKLPGFLDYVAYFGAAVFLGGIVVALAMALNATLGRLSLVEPVLLHRLFVEHVWAAAACLLIAIVISWRVGVNTFSLQHMYANRLVRCYLGASRQKNRNDIDRPTGPPCNSPPPVRHPSAITGFDLRDDIPLSSLQRENGYFGPLPIINTALNLTRGDELAWQQRKAESFSLTPYFAGSDSTGYRPMSEYAQDLLLGDAISISGAAVSPNMGYHTSPAVAALLTVFNVRLGAWLGNPLGKHWRRNEPFLGLMHLLKELCGRTDSRSSFVYLSDGGHFENLGVYELIRRRCRYIIACDADADSNFHFEDLGGLVRKCRTDLGVSVDLQIGPVRERNCCWVLGTVRYSDVNPGAEDGAFLYIKPVLRSAPPVDIDSYGKACPTFPHESTLDQFFSESQFESYRMLGQDSADQLLNAAIQRMNPATPDSGAWSFPEALFDELKRGGFASGESSSLTTSRGAGIMSTGAATTSIPEAQTVADVIAAMNSLQAALSDDDGLKWFNYLYLEVTKAVDGAVHSTQFKDPAWIVALDVSFANLYFAAVNEAQAAEGDMPSAWKPLFEARNQPGIARIQFALAGMNAHINRDLSVALATLAQKDNAYPSRTSDRYDDFETVNGLLEAVEAQVKAQLLAGFPPTPALADVIAMWSVAKARDAAWTNGEILFHVRAVPALADRFLATLDDTVGLAGRGLLVRT
jgi:hypothetical protein